ncbi:MAG: hypothetical protein A2161_05875 [Candidatus Schekmanbacteria bacterium RBG_13_48_7]|uniref:Uncharacterized protein n=1 Tax=Candidatus Schekmanbacteria bacterium RBG_13_48_7 TaxID=1817878 RepID=A0A1F7RSL9_9BACT|nr:MAG: hypothetical protein A2161_05875 [Candidatus Schekmanbacteria bacterium RBG_13_48_7]
MYVRKFRTDIYRAIENRKSKNRKPTIGLDCGRISIFEYKIKNEIHNFRTNTQILLIYYSEFVKERI